ncbi:50S ribosomal protein L28 [Acidipropionibacterium acidipropionici]|uniref:Large ribosomal subunit protein bL28 n=1 Tax=Acidipropionibacterium acidipropionici TaxID=1748 RepID=A0AAC8YFX5_9ACTN|nr:50S ribosomal protein L28 [Acidipropionibacterium acidipropionici]AMS05237.1 50S ribosomal protein L28 [Acidipropionibacterium acidipropionici]AOZ46717.1 50S ribosomal protein L28 [Acidipropionibacterium acidipropionici]AZP37214.1 50S ribosomal protein L28 [Acidipropionibacterium acidipropionici]
MARRCQVRGARPGYGNSVSHSQRHTRRRWEPNLQSKRYWVPSLGRQVKLRLTPKAMKIIDRRGIDAVVTDMLARGEKI